MFQTKVIDEVIKTAFSQRDAELFKDPEFYERFVNTERQAFVQGAAGYVQDAKIIFSPWGFDLKDVRGKVHLWYGTDDVFTPVNMGRYMAERLPNAKLTIYPDETHMSIFFQREEQVIADLLSDD